MNRINKHNLSISVNVVNMQDIHHLLIFLVAYAFYFLLAYKIDPRFSLKYTSPPSFYKLLGISTIETIIMLLVLVILNLPLGTNLITIFGLNRLHISCYHFLLGLIAGVLLFIIYFPVGMFIPIIRRKLLPEYKSEREEKVKKLIFISLPKSRRKAFTLLLIASLKAAIFEEIIFRAYLLGSLLTITSPVIALIVQAFLFFLPHLYQGIFNAILPFIGGIVFGLIYYLTGSLTVVIISHFTGNLIGLILQSIMMKKG